MGMFSSFRHWRTSIEAARIASAMSILRGYSLKHPESLRQWGADMLGLDTKAVANPYQQSIWVYRCINLWMRPATIPIRLLDRTGEPVEVDNDLTYLLRNPASNMTGQRMAEIWLNALGLDGEVNWLREDGSNTSGVPQFLTWVPAKLLSIEDGDRLNGSGRLVSMTLTAKGARRTIPLEGMIRQTLWNPSNPDRGLSPLEALRLTVDADYAARKHNKHQMQRHGRISGMVTFKDRVDIDVIQRYADLWREKYEGDDNAGKTAFADQGAAFQQLSLSPKDLDWLEGQKLSREEICGAFGIPPNNVGILDKATYSNFEQSSKSLWEDTLIPLAASVTTTLNRALVEPNMPGHRLEFDIANNVRALQTDEGIKLDRYIKLVTQGKVAPAQAAQMTGLKLGEPDPAHNVVWISASEVPADYVLTPEDPIQEQPAPAPAKSEQSAQLEHKPEFAPALETTRKSLPAQDIQFLQAKGRSILAGANAFERQLERVMKRFFWDQRQSVLTRAETITNKVKAWSVNRTTITSDPEQIATELMGGADWDVEIAKRTRPARYAAATTGAKQVLHEIAAPDQAFSDHVLESFLRDQGILLGKVNDYTLEALESVAQTLQDGVAAGENVDTLIDKFYSDMKGVYNRTEERRRTIARTESMRALNGGRMEQMKSSGVEEKEWIAVLDQETRESHVELNGNTVPVGASFHTTGGAAIAYPGDPSAPPGETINCRCTMVAKMTSGQMQDEDEE